MNEALLTIDPDIIKDFLTESDDIMTNLEKDLLELSDKGSDNPNLNSIINNIFRYVHTLKGT
nr:Hpt domain-containing protein [bacterium]